MSEIEKIVKEFSEREGLYEKLKKNLEFLVGQILENNEIKAQSITSRRKTEKKPKRETCAKKWKICVDKGRY